MFFHKHSPTKKFLSSLRRTVALLFSPYFQFYNETAKENRGQDIPGQDGPPKNSNRESVTGK